MLKKAEITVRGKVQGVFYRVWAKKQAEDLGLTGWARNERDGEVQIVVEGEEEPIQELIDRCWVGPELARVSGIKVEWPEYEGSFTGFSLQ